MAAAAEKKASKLGAVIPILVLTVVAGGGGTLIGKEIVAAARSAASAAASADATSVKAPGPPPAATRALKELVPVVTNLAAPEGAWIRLQTAIVYDKADAPQMDVIGTKVGEDILAFVRTLSLEQIQGASGLQALRDDLNERATLRSDGKVRELLIEMLVVR